MNKPNRKNYEPLIGKSKLLNFDNYILYINELEKFIGHLESKDNSVLHSVNRWATIDEKPKKYGKYFVRRKDGKVHWETWNGSGWAYNSNSITHWSEIIMPSI